MKYDALRLELDRIVRQRNTLLRQAGGRLDDAAAFTLDVWDAKLADVGEQLRPRPGARWSTAAARASPTAYAHLAGGRSTVDARLRPAVAARRPGRRRWPRRAATTCAAACRRSGRTATSSSCASAAMPARTHASQGEQRTLALALRLAAHRLVAERTGSTPVLVLDDVLSELDAASRRRAAAAPPAGPGRDHHRRGDPRRRPPRSGHPHRGRRRRLTDLVPALRRTRRVERRAVRPS